MKKEKTRSNSKLSVQRRFIQAKRAMFSDYSYSVGEAIAAIEDLYIDLYIEYWFREPAFTRRDFLSVLIAALMDNMIGLSYRETSMFLWDEMKKNNSITYLWYKLRFDIGDYIYRKVSFHFLNESIAIEEENNFILSKLLIWATEELSKLERKSLENKMEEKFAKGTHVLWMYDWNPERQYITWDDPIEEDLLPTGTYIEDPLKEKVLTNMRFEL